MFKRIKIFKDVFFSDEKLILRDYLSLERTKLANERTFLSYLRTSLYMLLGGIAFLQLQDFTRIRWIGFLAISLSIVFVLIGTFRYFQIKIRLKKYYKQEGKNLQ